MSLWNCICCLDDVKHTWKREKKKSPSSSSETENKATEKSIRKSNYHDLSFDSILQNFLDRMQSMPASKTMRKFRTCHSPKLIYRIDFVKQSKPVGNQYQQWRHTSMPSERARDRERAMNDAFIPQTLFYDVINMYECVFSAPTHTYTQPASQLICNGIESRSRVPSFSCRQTRARRLFLFSCGTVIARRKGPLASLSKTRRAKHISMHSVAAPLPHRASLLGFSSCVLAVLLPLQQQSFVAATVATAAAAATTPEISSVHGIVRIGRSPHTQHTPRGLSSSHTHSCTRIADFPHNETYCCTSVVNSLPLGERRVELSILCLFSRLFSLVVFFHIYIFLLLLYFSKLIKKKAECVYVYEFIENWMHWATYTCQLVLNALVSGQWILHLLHSFIYIDWKRSRNEWNDELKTITCDKCCGELISLAIAIECTYNNKQQVWTFPFPLPFHQ